MINDMRQALFFVREYYYWPLLFAVAMAAAVSSMLAPVQALSLPLFVLIGLLAITRVPIWLFLAGFVALLAFPFSVEGPLGAELSPQNVGLLLLVFLAFDQIWRHRVRYRIRLAPIVILYTLVSLIAISRGPALKGGFADVWILYRLVLIGPLAYFAFSVLFARTTRIQVCMKFLAVASAIIGLLGILQTATSEGILPGSTQAVYMSGTSIFRAYGTFEHPNAYGIFLSTTLFLSWGVYTSTETRRGRLFWLAVIGLQLGGIVVSFSRTAWVATIAGILVLVLFSLRRNLIRPQAIRRGLIVVAIGVLALIVAYYRVPVFAERLQSISNPQEVGEFRWRVVIWEYALREIMRHPLLGKGTTVITAAEVGFSGQLKSFSSHNLLISMAYGRGLLATALYLLITVLYLLVGLQLQLKRRLLSVDKSFVTSLIAAMIAFQVSGIGTATMNWASLSILYWLITAILFAIYDNERASKQLHSTCFG